MFPITSQTLSTFGRKLFEVLFLFTPNTHARTEIHRYTIKTQTRPWHSSEERKKNINSSWDVVAICGTVIVILLLCHPLYKFGFKVSVLFITCFPKNSIENVKSFHVNVKR